MLITCRGVNQEISPLNMTTLTLTRAKEVTIHTFKASFLSEESLVLSDLKDDISSYSKSGDTM